MLPKSERLTKSDFIGLRPRIILRGTFVDIAITSSTSSKFACVIAKKRIKKAVDRNKVKRRIYSVLSFIKPKSHHLIVIYPKITVLNGKYTHIESEIKTAFDTL